MSIPRKWSNAFPIAMVHSTDESGVGVLIARILSIRFVYEYMLRFAYEDLFRPLKGTNENLDYPSFPRAGKSLGLRQ